jgi:predicted transcriptional regulator YdeE
MENQTFNLTEKPDSYTWPESHYIFIEKTGPFQTTAPAAWQEFHQQVGTLVAECGFVSMTSLYKVEPKMIYRAGAMVKSAPKNLPSGFGYEKFPGGKYARFTYTGPYSNLPAVSGKVFDLTRKIGLPMRNGFFIENYPNDPKMTPEEQLITEIMIPTL